MNKHNKKIRGFTLIELMITLAVAAITLTIGIPAFQTLQANSTRTTRINELVASLQLARSEAVKRSSRVTLCRSSDSTNCLTGGAAEWANGWIVFEDADSDTVPDAAEVIRVRRIANPGYTLISTYGDTLVFDGNGAPVPAGAGTFTLTLDGTARTLAVSTTGRPQLQ